jgi:ubiquinone/menaquinone biosynthesis C-methylase UbiE
MTRDLSTEQTRKLWDAYARRYDRDIRFFERVLFAGARQWACGRASGDTLEIAMGTGRNLAWYPDGVRLTGIELSERMLAIARERAAHVRPDADLRLGDAQALPFGDSSFDTVVVTLGLCVVPDERKAIAEVYRVLRPGGSFVAVEHVASPNTAVRATQRLLETITYRWTGDHLTREPLRYLGAAGFTIEELIRSKWGIVESLRARKP